MHVAIALLPNGRSRANNNSHNNRNAKRLPRAAWSLCSTGARLMQTNAKFTTGKLSTARWLRDRETESESESELESKSKIRNGNGKREQPLWWLWQLLPAVHFVVVVISQLYGNAPLRKCKFDLRRLECVSCGASQCVYFG